MDVGWVVMPDNSQSTTRPAALVAVVGSRQAKVAVSRGLEAVAHRGGVAGIGSIESEKGSALGTVSLRGGASASPVTAWVRGKRLIAATLGAIVNRQDLVELLSVDGGVFRDGSETEVLMHLVARSSLTTDVNRLVDAVTQLSGAFSILVLTEERGIAICDPRGFRPLWLGQKDGAHFLASESGAIVAMGAQVVRALRPGEMLMLEPDVEPQSLFPWGQREEARCVMDAVALMRSEGRINDEPAYGLRRRLGACLAMEAPAHADVVVPFGSNNIPAAQGYAAGLGLPLDFAITEGGAVVESLVAGRRVVLVLSSDCTARSAREAVRALRDAFAREVHVRVAGPLCRHECPYGTEAFAGEGSTNPPVSAVSARRGAPESVAALSLPALREALQTVLPSFCHACVSGSLPVAMPVSAGVEQLELFVDSREDSVSADYH